MIANSTKWEDYHGHLVARHEGPTLVLTWWGPKDWSHTPGVDMVRFDPENQLLSVFPRLAILGNHHQQFSRVRELQLDTASYSSNFDIEIDEGTYGLEISGMPDGFGSVFAYGLGLRRQYREIIRAIESVTDCDVVRFGPPEAEGVNGTVFRIGLDRFSRYKHAVDLNYQRAHTVVGRVNDVAAYNAIADLVGKAPKTPIIGRHPIIQAITRELTDDVPLDTDQRAALVKRMSTESERVAREDPPAFGKLRKDIELVTLEFLIEQFGNGLRGANAKDESWWQRFFKVNTFALQQLFAAPVALYGDQLQLRLPTIHASGGRIADFVLVNSLTNTAVVVEIKAPATRLLGSRYRGAEGAEVYPPHRDLSGAVAQLQAQMESAVTDFPTLVGQTPNAPAIETSTVRGAVIVGRFEPLDNERRQSFTRYRSGLQAIEVLTFDEVHGRLEGLRTMLSARPS
ncbi:Shedu anti-phage system protein SduA domain-containing protein [Mycobacterium interjectum]|uniref:Shedu anti-phage system protein SduA domain-containing protein n=1 Tax=Mycobacterium interjectum TaxID=33895 RepID=UPI0008377C01|nr:Shedu anti-phage system protein SduA domain-containing protein [Mycobacterium interjectum]MCV7091648.1 DUF4263 domain-containing protein [Mycobacterium interjectum]